VVKALVLAAIGLWAAMLANQGIALYHDGVRPVLPSYLQGEMSRREVSRLSVTLSMSFILLMGVPVSIVSEVLVVYPLLLGADIIGLSIPSLPLAALAGAGLGFGLSSGLHALPDLYWMLPVNPMEAFTLVVQPVVQAFFIVPALAIGYRFGKGKGLTVLLGTLATKQLGQVVLSAAAADLLAMAAGTVVLLALCLSPRNSAAPPVDQSLLPNHQRLRRALVPLVVMGGLIGVASHMRLVAGEPIAAALLAADRVRPAAAIAIFSALGFLPLVAPTSLMTGTHATGGICDWILGIAYLAPTWYLGGLAGAAVMALEVTGLLILNRWMDVFPGLRVVGESIRTAMMTYLDVTLLVGGFMASAVLWPGNGVALLAGFYLTNELAGRPVARMAVGPLGAILTAAAVNVLALL